MIKNLTTLILPILPDCCLPLLDDFASDIFEYLEEVIYPSLFPVLTHDGEIDAYLMLRFLQFCDDDMWFTHLDEDDISYTWMLEESRMLIDFEPLPGKIVGICEEHRPLTTQEPEHHCCHGYVESVPDGSTELDAYRILELFHSETNFTMHMDDDLFLYLRVTCLYILSSSALVQMMKRWLRYLHQYQCRPPRFSKSSV